MIFIGAIVFHVAYACLVYKMKDDGIDAGYGGQFLNYFQNMAKFKAYYREKGLPLGPAFYALRIGQFVGSAGILFLVLDWLQRTGRLP